MKIDRRVLPGDEVKVLSQEGRKAKVIDIYQKNEGQVADVQVRFDDGTTAQLSLGEIELLNR